jgi:peptidoglycan/LPS O-acetylase OafA/YrhL
MRTAWRRFFMLETDARRIVAMEGLRGYATLLVFFVHALVQYDLAFHGVNLGDIYGQTAGSVWQTYPVRDALLLWLQKAHYGVDLFFLLSGFLIYRVVARHHENYGRFLWKRVLRIYPAFLASLLVAVVAKHYWLGRPFDTAVILGNLVFLNGCPGFNITAYNGVSWSLFYEFSFYLSFPLLWQLLTRGDTARAAVSSTRPLRWAAILAMVLVSNVWLPRFGMFYFGVMLAMCSDDELRQAARNIPGWLLGGAYLVVTAGYRYYPLHFEYFTPCYGLVSSLLFVKACYGTGWLNRLFSWTPLRWLGNISYSFYLMHGLVIGFLNKFVLRFIGEYPWPVSVTIHFIITFCVSAVASVGLYAVCERWYFARKPKAAASAAVPQPPAPRLAA